MDYLLLFYVVLPWTHFVGWLVFFDCLGNQEAWHARLGRLVVGHVRDRPRLVRELDALLGCF